LTSGFRDAAAQNEVLETSFSKRLGSGAATVQSVSAAFFAGQSVVSDPSDGGLVSVNGKHGRDDLMPREDL
jgi:hypothetical protein